MSHNVHVGHRPVEFEKTAWHMVPSGDEAQAAEALAVHPPRRLLRIAERIIRLMTEGDTAERPIWRVPCRAQQVLEIDPLIDPRHEELTAFAFAQEFEAALQAKAAARQHDNRVGRS